MEVDLQTVKYVIYWQYTPLQGTVERLGSHFAALNTLDY